MAAGLTVEFAGQRRHLDERESAIFGRGAAIDIDSNPFLHRQVGRFLSDESGWSLEAIGASTPLTVISGGFAARIAAPEVLPLRRRSSVVRFSAGSCHYELDVHLDDPPDSRSPQLPPVPEGSTATFQPLGVVLSDEQRLLVVALAEQRLRHPERPLQLPSNASTASRLGWSTAKFNRKLDWLCARLHRLGVDGLKAHGRRSNDRRRHLIEHLISLGVIDADDLALLDAHIGDHAGS